VYALDCVLFRHAAQLGGRDLVSGRGGKMEVVGYVPIYDRNTGVAIARKFPVFGMPLGEHAVVDSTRLPGVLLRSLAGTLSPDDAEIVATAEAIREQADCDPFDCDWSEY
jgi:hypothetical protein